MIFDGETNDFVNSLIGTLTAWIGAHRVAVDDQIPSNDQFSWIDGSALFYNNWRTETDEPNNWEGKELCATVNNLNKWSDGTWNDFVCDTYEIDYYVCQI